jgi:hypothetical protein
VLVIEFEGEGGVDQHNTSRQGGQQQTDEVQVEVAPNIDLHQILPNSRGHTVEEWVVLAVQAIAALGLIVSLKIAVRLSNCGGSKRQT